MGSEDIKDVNIKDTNIKQKILKSLKPKKKFLVYWGETLWYEKEVEAVDKEDVKKMFDNDGIEVDGGDVVDSDFMEDSFEVRFEVREL